jgi:hypothetical protein
MDKLIHQAFRYYVHVTFRSDSVSNTLSACFVKSNALCLHGGIYLCQKVRYHSCKDQKSDTFHQH